MGAGRTGGRIVRNTNNHLRTGNGRTHSGRGGTYVARSRRPQTHLCFVPGCECRIRISLLMCQEHWSQVPEHIQDQVGTAWEEFKYWPGDREAVAKYSAARRAAVNAVKQKEGQDA